MKWKDEDLDLALRELGEEELPPAALAAVRARVLEAMERPRVRWWMWAWAPALGLLAALVWPRPASVAPPPLLAAAPVPPAWAWVKTDLRQELVTRTRPVVKQTEFIRLFTDDPDVVILWSLETKGDEE